MPTDFQETIELPPDNVILDEPQDIMRTPENDMPRIDVSKLPDQVPRIDISKLPDQKQKSFLPEWIEKKKLTPTDVGVLGAGKELVKEVGEGVIGAGEALMTISSGAMLWPFSKAYGLMALPFGAGAAKMAEESIAGVGYQPYREGGKAVSDIVGKGMETFLTPTTMATEQIERFSPEAAYLVGVIGEAAQFAGVHMGAKPAINMVKAKAKVAAQIGKAKKAGAQVMELNKVRTANIGKSIIDSEVFIREIDRSHTKVEREAIPFLLERPAIPEKSAPRVPQKNIGGGKPPKTGLVVANIGVDGKIYYGKPGDLHYELSLKYGKQIRKDAGLKSGEGTWADIGFADKTGKLFHREEALSMVDVKPSLYKELDALDLREQVKAKTEKIATKRVLPTKEEVPLERLGVGKLKTRLETGADKSLIEQGKSLIEMKEKPEIIHKAEVKAVIDNPSAEVLKTTDKIKKYYKEAHKFLQENSDDVGFVKNYVNHIWDIPKGKRSEILSSFTTKNPFTKKRTIPTYEEGIEMGLTPKSTDISYLLRVYDQYKIKTAHNNKYAHALKDMVGEDGNPLVMRGDKAPLDWVEIQHPAIDRAMAVGMTKIKGVDVPILSQRAVRVHPDIAKEVKLIFDKPFHSTTLSAIETVNAFTKKSMLSISMFHHLALT
ncbi:MAG: hypothetical protein KAS04_00425, partial [Candidatus Aenigmarchaeota archaeon]|nr:hypothetical protein [Candidatus Aenigmarchaeota archaeon]